MAARAMRAMEAAKLGVGSVLVRWCVWRYSASLRADQWLKVSSLVSESIGTERASLSRVFVRLKLCCWPDPYTRQVTS